MPLKDESDQLRLIELDVTNQQHIEALIGNLDQQPIDILFNNAGYYGPKNSELGQLDVGRMAECITH